MLFMLILAILASCQSRPGNLEDVSQEVIQKDRGVIIDIEPGKK